MDGAADDFVGGVEPSTALFRTAAQTMSETFDPYLKWLGIRDPKRPPNHYRLLGVAPFEDDPSVLARAADRQMAHVRKFQTGKYSAQSQRLLNELAAAKICLLSPEKKAPYDARLRAELGTGQADRGTSPAATGTIAPPARMAFNYEPAEAPAGESSPLFSCAIAALVAMVLTLGGLILIATMRNGPKEEKPGTGEVAQVVENESESDLQPETPEPEEPGPDTSEPEDLGPDTPQPDVPDPDTVEPDVPQPDVVQPDAAQPTAVQRLAVPPALAKTKMLKQIRELFKEDYALATVPASKRALAGMLLKKALETKDDPVARYVLLTEARDLAVEVGDAEMFLETVKLIGKQYTVDWLVMATAVLQASAKRSRLPQANEALGNTALSLAGQAVDRDEYEMAAILAEAARDMGRATRSTTNRIPQLVVRAVAMMRNVAAWRQQYEAFLQAEKVLAGQPGDAEANLAAGKYYCFVKGDFERGLPMIIVGPDAVLRALAEAELAQPSETAEMVDLADRWWAAAEAAEGPDRRSFQGRAVHWYELVLPDLTGLTRDMVRHRVGQYRGSSLERRN